MKSTFLSLMIALTLSFFIQNNSFARTNSYFPIREWKVYKKPVTLIIPWDVTKNVGGCVVTVHGIVTLVCDYIGPNYVITNATSTVTSSTIQCRGNGLIFSRIDLTLTNDDTSVTDVTFSLVILLGTMYLIPS